MIIYDNNMIIMIFNISALLKQLFTGALTMNNNIQTFET